MFGIRNLVLLFSLVSVVTIRTSSAQVQTSAPNKIPVPVGAQVTLERVKVRYFLGENIVATFRIKNVGIEPFPIFDGNGEGHTPPSTLKVTVIDSEGKPVEPVIPLCPNFLGYNPGRVLTPNTSWFTDVTLNQYYRFQTSGMYKISAQQDLNWLANPERPQP